MSIDINQFKGVFFEESFEGLDIMEEGLLKLESDNQDMENINTIFRAAHSIKGGSGTFGLDCITGFTHTLETLLDEVREGARVATPKIIELLLKSVDCLREMLEVLKEEQEPDMGWANELQASFDKVLGDENEGGSSDSTTSQIKKDGKAENAGVWNIRFKPNKNILCTGNEPWRMFRELEELGEITVKVDYQDMPALEEADPEICYLAWDISLEAITNSEAIEKVFEWVIDDCTLTINEPKNTVIEEKSKAQDKKQDVAETVSVSKEKKAQSAEASSIRVNTSKIDELINMVGELVINQSMLSQLGQDFSIQKLENLREGLVELEQNTRSIQESVMRIRMLPISFVFTRFPRLVRDISQKLNKDIDLVISGEQTELDKTVLEKINDPLVHLIRNSLDHGIEMPDDREAAGKSRTGVLNLDAYHEGGSIFVRIKDDGAGLNKDKILKKAIDAGLVAPGEKLSDDKIYDLIFHPGLSTADTVSDVSGRGVGMDVVRKNIASLGGTIGVESMTGKGTTITIKMPLTLAILDGQLARIGSQIYVIPLTSIVESLQIKIEDVNRVADAAEVYQLREEYVPIIRMRHNFSRDSDDDELSNSLLVVVENDKKKYGFVLDELLAQQQVVIKSLEENYRRVSGISGATILGDGTVALILDVPGIIRDFGDVGQSSPEPDDSQAA